MTEKALFQEIKTHEDKNGCLWGVCSHIDILFKTKYYERTSTQ